MTTQTGLRGAEIFGRHPQKHWFARVDVLLIPGQFRRGSAASVLLCTELCLQRSYGIPEFRE